MKKYTNNEYERNNTMKNLITRSIVLLFAASALFLWGCGSPSGSPSGFGSKSLIVELHGANEYETAEIVGKLIHATRGVRDARILAQKVVPNNPQACMVKWQVSINSSETDTFRLQTNILKNAQDLIDAGGQTVINGVPFRNTRNEIWPILGLVPASTTSQLIGFVIDFDKARARELSGEL